MKLLRSRSDLAPELQARLDEHVARAGDLVRGAVDAYVNGGFRREAARAALEPARDDRGLALSAFVTASTLEDYLRGTMRGLLPRNLPFERSDVELLVALAERHQKHWYAVDEIRAATTALEVYAKQHGPVPELSERLLRLTAKQRDAEATKLAVRLRGLVPSRGLDVSMLKGDDAWAKRVRRIVEKQFGGCGELLGLLGAATQSKPTQKWIKSVGPLLAGEGERLVRMLLEEAAASETRQLGTHVLDDETYAETMWLADPSATVVRGALWAAALVDDDEWAVDVAVRLAERARAEYQLRVHNSAVWMLGERASDEAVAVLSRWAAKIKDRNFLKGIAKALERAAEQRGLTSAQLRERMVPTLDLSADGTREIPVGPHLALVELAAPASVAVTWRTADGKEQRSPPESVRAAKEDAPVKQLAAELRKELSVQKLRLESLLADERTWELPEWREHYLTHPLVQLFTRRLIWRFDEVAGIPLEDDRLLTLDGDAAVPERGSVQLWHPIGEPAETVAAWRRLVLGHELVQPFKQAFREVYYVAPAELDTGLYSNRFAAHILRYPQLYALAKQRGWGIRALGPYDNDGGEQWRDFTAQGLRASFWCELVDVDADDAPIAELAATDQVRFSRIGEHDPIRLADVPPVVFSEAMRDVDLFIAVASIAADPHWTDHGLDRYNAYWQSYSFGELGESALVRRELLAEILPSLKIADRCELTDRFLRVRGNVRAYKIHLGSSNVLMEPNDEYLCIVPARRSGFARVYLPFPDDERFSVILSKAFLLAADDKITDKTITRQIAR